MNLPIVVGLCATKNRVRHLRKAMRCFLEQDYEGLSILYIYNNAKESQQLGNIKLPDNKKIILVNNYKKIGEDRYYENLGEIYNDIIETSPMGDIALIMDDDDTYLPNHFSEGVKGFKRGGVLAYKPLKSYFKGDSDMRLDINTFEPSIFVDYNYLKATGCYPRSSKLHYKWIEPLTKENLIFIDPKGLPTFIYDWSGIIPVFKISGDEINPSNFSNHNNWSKDFGSGILEPITKEELLQYETKYDLLYREQAKICMGN